MSDDLKHTGSQKTADTLLIRLRPGKHDEIIAWKSGLRDEYGAIQREAIKALQFWIDHGEGQQVPDPPASALDASELNQLIANALDRVPTRDEVQRIVETVVAAALSDLALTAPANATRTAESEAAADTLNAMLAGLNEDDEGEEDDT